MLPAYRLTWMAAKAQFGDFCGLLAEGGDYQPPSIGGMKATSEFGSTFSKKAFW